MMSFPSLTFRCQSAPTSGVVPGHGAAGSSAPAAVSHPRDRGEEAAGGGEAPRKWHLPLPPQTSSLVLAAASVAQLCPTCTLTQRWWPPP